MSNPLTFPVRADVVGTRISMTSYEEILELIRTPRADRATVIAVCNVHSVMSARRDPELHAALEGADVATPDGMPLVWALRRMYRPSQQRVYGPDVMRRVLAEAADARHFLYGSSEGTLNLLVARVSEDFPNANVVGALAPPFRGLTREELDRHLDLIRSSAAEIVWVGLGMPKQELWMSQAAPKLPGMTLIGVGAAFDFLAGTIRQAPPWMRNAGLEWLFRLAMEPRRLWRRYVYTNPAFIVAIARQRIAWRLRSLGNSAGSEKATTDP